MNSLSIVCLCASAFSILPSASSIKLGLRGTRAAELPTVYGFDAVGEDSWLQTFNLVPKERFWRASLNTSANHLLVKDNVCVSNGTGEFDGPVTFSGTPPERVALEGLLNIKPIPTNHTGPVHEGLTVIITVHHYGSYYWGNLEHMAEAVLPIFDTLDLLGEEGQKEYGLKPAVNILLHQALKDAGELIHSDWFYSFMGLLSTDPNRNMEFYYMDDLMGNKSLCFEQVLLLDRPSVNELGHMERHFFTYESTAARWRAKTINHFGLSPALLTRQPARQATFIYRNDSQGFVNQGEVAEKVRQFLEERCWSMNLYVPSGKKPYRMKDQVEQFAQADLSISVHGAHLTNIMYQPKAAGTIIIQKCGFEDKDFTQLALESGLAAFQTYPADCDRIPVVTLQEHGNVSTQNQSISKRILSDGDEIKDLHQEYVLNFDAELRPALEEAINILELNAVRGPPCHQG